MDLASLSKMANLRSEWCVSIYLPIEKENIADNQERLKKLENEAKQKLAKKGVSETTTDKVFLPLGKVLEYSSFHQNTKETLVLFLAPNAFVRAIVPLEAENLVVVAEQFYTQPLFLSSQKESHSGKSGRKQKRSQKSNLPMIPLKLLKTRLIV